jgi:hypothetical protein
MLNFVVDKILTHGVLFKAKFLLHIFSLGVVVNRFFQIPLRLPLDFSAIGTYNTQKKTSTTTNPKLTRAQIVQA